MTLQIEAGKSYRTDNGVIFGPLKDSDDRMWPFEGPFIDKTGEPNMAYFRSDGSCPFLSQYDLIEEVTL